MHLLDHAALVVQLALVPMATLAEWIQGQTADAKTVLVAVFGVILTGGAIWRIVKAGFGLGAIVMTLVVAGLAGWLVLGDGIHFVQTLFNNQSKG